MEAAANAVRADADLAEAQHALGQVNWFFEWNWPAAEVAYRRAVTLDPGFAWAHAMLGHLLSQCGRHDEARTRMQSACEIEPLAAIHHAMSSQVAFQARDYATALAQARQAIAVDPAFWVGYMMRGQAHGQMGEWDAALEALADAARLSGSNSKAISTKGYVLATQGRSAEAREVLAMLEEVARLRYVPPYAIALVHAGLKARDAVFEWLLKACDARDVHLLFLTVDPKWDPYRDDPRFTELLERCNFMRNVAPGIQSSAGRTS